MAIRQIMVTGILPILELNKLPVTTALFFVRLIPESEREGIGYDRRNLGLATRGYVGWTAAKCPSLASQSL
jgi:hypothetical protein